LTQIPNNSFEHRLSMSQNQPIGSYSYPMQNPNMKVVNTNY
jgi:hypothetical protein